MLVSHWDGCQPTFWSVAQLAPEAAAIGGFKDPYTDPIKLKKDTKGNAVVLNEPGNGVLAGELILAHRNKYKDRILGSGKVGKGQHLLYGFLDLNSAQWSVLLRERQLRIERQALASDVAIMIFVQHGLGQTLSQEQRTSLCSALARIALSHENVRDEHKRGLQAQAEAAGRVPDSLGRWNPQAKRARLVSAIREGQLRLDDLDGVELANIGRTNLVDHEVVFHSWAVGEFLRWLELVKVLDRDQLGYQNAGHLVRYKPEMLSINNGWYRRHDDDALVNLWAGLTIFCPLYGALMRPLRILGSMSHDEIEVRSGTVIGLFDDLMVILNLVKLRGDHGLLLDRFLALVVGTHHELLSGKPAEAKDMADRAKHLLRYRVERGETKAPVEWYNGLKDPGE